jgi:hypothetical protein
MIMSTSQKMGEGQSRPLTEGGKKHSQEKASNLLERHAWQLGRPPRSLSHAMTNALALMTTQSLAGFLRTGPRKMAKKELEPRAN